jgi:hypothetical protein
MAAVLKDDSEATRANTRREIATLTERFRPYPDVV